MITDVKNLETPSFLLFVEKRTAALSINSQYRFTQFGYNRVANAI